MKAGIVAVILCGVLFQAGCGQKEDVAAEESSGNVEITLRQMELLQFEDPENENLADLLQRAGSGMMVQLWVDNVQGSGVLYGIDGGDLVILTAAHVLEEAEGAVAVTFADEWSILAEGYECSTLGDFAVVRVSGENVPTEHLEQYLCANVDKDSFDAAVSETGCIVMGCRAGVAAEAYEGVILDHWIYMEDYGQYMMWVKAEGLPGMSGGGLFDRQGHFLGILSGESEDGELAVVPLSLILAELQN